MLTDAGCQALGFATFPTIALTVIAASHGFGKIPCCIQ
jgi:hypothetical protein